MKIKSFHNRVSFVTGGSSGIGLSTAKLLVSKGARVAIFARDRGRLEKAVEELKSHKVSDDQQVVAFSLDVTNPVDVETVFNRAIEECGTPELLINCAGRAVPHYFEEIPYEQFETTMRTNFFGVRNCTAVVIPHMKRAGTGFIVSVSSMAGLLPLFGLSDYCASKAAIIAFSDVIRAEYKPFNVSVSVVLPPDTDTPGFREENTTKPPETKALSDFSTVVKPEFVAEKIVKGIGKGKFIIIPQFSERVFYLINRLFPGLVRTVLDGTVKKVREKGAA